MKLDPSGKEKLSQAFPRVNAPRQLKAGQAGRWRVPGGYAFGVGTGNGEYELLGGAGAAEAPAGGGTRVVATSAEGADIKRWGAKGDGVTDDTGAIQKALDNDTRGEIFFSKGTYCISNALTASRAITLRFVDEAKITCAVGFTGNKILLVTASNFTAYNFRADGTNLPQEATVYVGTDPDPDGIGVKFLGTSGAHLENIRMVGGLIENTPFSAVMMDYVDNSVIQGLETYKCSDYQDIDPPASIYTVRCTGVLVSGCTVRESGRKGIACAACTSVAFLGNAVSDGQNDGHAALYAATSQEVVIANNVVRSCAASKISHLCDNVVVANNAFYDGHGGLILQGCKNVLMTGNVCRDCSASGEDGLYIQQHGSYLIGLENITVIDNLFINSTPSATGYGILLDSSDPAAGVWEATHAMNAGQWVVPTTFNNYVYKASAGTTGGSEPTWPTTVGGTVVDGGVTWRCYDYEVPPLKHFTIKNNTIEGFLFGVSLFNTNPGGHYEDFTVEGNTFRTIGDAAIRVYAKRLIVRGNLIDGVDVNQAILLNSASGTTWAGAIDYVTYNYVAPTVYNGYLYHCVKPGTSHAVTEPTWPTTPGDTVSDGTILWECVDYPNLEEVRVTGNTIRNAIGGNGIFAIAGERSLLRTDVLEISGNIVDMTGGGASVWPIRLYTPRVGQLIVRDNILIGSAAAEAIIINTEAGTPVNEIVTGNQCGAKTIRFYNYGVDVTGGYCGGNASGGYANRPASLLWVDPHATTHQAGGADPIKLDDLAAPDANTDLNASATKHGLLPMLSDVETQFLNGKGAWAVPAGGGSDDDFNAQMAALGLETIDRLRHGVTPVRHLGNLAADGHSTDTYGAKTYCAYRGTPNYDLGISEQELHGYGGFGGVVELGDVAGTEYRHAQKFTLAGATLIARVTVSFLGTSGSPSGQVTATIQTDAGGLPSGTLAHANATKAFTPTTGGSPTLNTVDFTDFPLDAGTYHLVLDCGNQSNNVYWEVVYNAGEDAPYREVKTASWSSVNGERLGVRVYGYVEANAVSKAFPFPANPAKLGVALLLSANDAGVTLQVSRDNGSTWTACPLTQVGDAGSYRGATLVDLSAQPPGATVKYKVLIAASTAATVRGVAIYGR